MNRDALRPRGRPITVQCGGCQREQLRWSNDYPNGLRLAELEAIGWVWDESVHEWRCPFCWETTHAS